MNTYLVYINIEFHTINMIVIFLSLSVNKYERNVININTSCIVKEAIWHICRIMKCRGHVISCGAVTTSVVCVEGEDIVLASISENISIRLFTPII